MHQSSPISNSTASNGGDDLIINTSQTQPTQLIAQHITPPHVDKYCSDCDIRFSSTKTYRAHKQHYCSSRHREE